MELKLGTSRHSVSGALLPSLMPQTNLQLRLVRVVAKAYSNCACACTRDAVPPCNSESDHLSCFFFFEINTHCDPMDTHRITRKLVDREKYPFGALLVNPPRHLYCLYPSQSIETRHYPDFQATAASLSAIDRQSTVRRCRACDDRGSSPLGTCLVSLVKKDVQGLKKKGARFAKGSSTKRLAPGMSNRQCTYAQLTNYRIGYANPILHNTGLAPG